MRSDFQSFKNLLHLLICNTWCKFGKNQFSGVDASRDSIDRHRDMVLYG